MTSYEAREYLNMGNTMLKVCFVTKDVQVQREMCAAAITVFNRLVTQGSLLDMPPEDYAIAYVIPARTGLAKALEVQQACGFKFQSGGLGSLDRKERAEAKRVVKINRVEPKNMTIPPLKENPPRRAFGTGDVPTRIIFKSLVKFDPDYNTFILMPQSYIHGADGDSVQAIQVNALLSRLCSTNRVVRERTEDNFSFIYRVVQPIYFLTAESRYLSNEVTDNGWGVDYLVPLLAGLNSGRCLKAHHMVQTLVSLGKRE